MTDEQVIAYLLGELDDHESERFEEELFATDEWSEELPGIENDLVVAYLRKELTPERRRRFEENYLCSDARRQRVTFAAAMLRRIDDLGPAPVNETSWFQKWLAGWNERPLAFRLAVAVAALVVVIGGIWLVGVSSRPPRTSMAVTLSMTETTRSDGPAPKIVTLPLGQDEYRLTLTLPAGVSPAAKYQVELENKAGKRNSLENTNTGNGTLIAILPASDLEPGSYVIILSFSDNGAPIARVPGSYHFTVK